MFLKISEVSGIFDKTNQFSRQLDASFNNEVVVSSLFFLL